MKTIEVPVNDLERAVRFYCEVLGFQVIARNGYTTSVASTAYNLELTLVAPPPQASINLPCADREQMAADILRRGGNAHGGWVQIPDLQPTVCTDPFGNVLLLRTPRVRGPR